uniref:Uncharacterized protein n=1 Tax=Ascaris lumbricoides TaxID=6252 RepID=A0A9J2PW16_ASCLU
MQRMRSLTNASIRFNRATSTNSYDNTTFDILQPYQP